MPIVEAKRAGIVGKKKSPSNAGTLLTEAGRSDLLNVGGLRTLLSLNDFELDLIAFGERLEAVAGDGAEVDENIGSTLTRDETEAFRVVEPLHGAGDACHGTLPFPLWG